jgi:uncharacterized protein (TIGR02145 family)
MARNLDVTTYRNGDIIPEVKDSAAWAKLKTGAWCYYKNDPANGKVYGKLYNWYAVNDPRGLAPEGWHVPTDEEWNTLTKTLGGDEIAGGKMKEMGTEHWGSPNTGATNSSGFTALPGGLRFDVGDFVGIGNRAFWWSITESHPSSIMYRYVHLASGYLNKDEWLGGQAGFSVRCVKD